MDTLFSIAGVVGATCCVGMFAAVSLGHASPDRMLYFIINGFGAVLVMISAWYEFDLGDLGTMLQEVVWIALSVVGGFRVWRSGQRRKAQVASAAHRPVLHAVQATAGRTDPTGSDQGQDLLPQRAAS